MLNHTQCLYQALSASTRLKESFTAPDLEQSRLLLSNYICSQCTVSIQFKIKTDFKSKNKDEVFE